MTLLTFDFNILLVLRYSVALGGPLCLLSPTLTDAHMAVWMLHEPVCRHTASMCSLVLGPLTIRLLETRPATPPTSHSFHVLHLLPQSCFPPLNHGAFLTNGACTANGWVQVTVQMPSVKAGTSGRKFWSITDGLIVKTSIFKLSSLTELLPCYSQAKQEALGGFLLCVLRAYHFI